MRLLLIFLLLTVTGVVNAQQKNAETDTSYQFVKRQPESPFIKTEAGMKPTIRTLIIPLSLITYGVVSQTSEDLKEFDTRIKTEIREKKFHTPVDNYLQYAPGLAVFGLNAAGIKGKHNFRDRMLTYLLANVMMGVTVQSIKTITKVRRPDGFGSNAFPSGHTATAFTGAEFLRQEYKNVSPWYGIAGYTAATATGILRMYNNKHWLRDVVAGAGIGILSTQVAYWLEPKIAKILFHKKTSFHFDPSNF
ncbi:MAG TPA: phosphatase PAP2 family protein [Chitinophagaceae bacterium]